MYCPKCGAEAVEGAAYCAKCGNALNGAINQQDKTSRTSYQAPPKSWLTESILATILCCAPFGIVGIVYASSVDSKFRAGDYEGAVRASQRAGSWTMWAFIGGFFTCFIASAIALL